MRWLGEFSQPGQAGNLVACRAAMRDADAHAAHHSARGHARQDAALERRVSISLRSGRVYPSCWLLWTYGRKVGSLGPAFEPRATLERDMVRIKGFLCAHQGRTQRSSGPDVVRQIRVKWASDAYPESASNYQ